MTTRLQILAALCLGFILGRMFANKISKVSTKTEIVSTVTKTEGISQQVETQKLATMSQQMNYTEKSFSKKGILLHEISYNTNSGTSSKEQHFETYKVQTAFTQTSDVKTSTVDSYQSNWIIGAYHPISLKFQPMQINLMLAYRLIGGIYIAGMTDVKFKMPMVGIQIQF